MCLQEKYTEILDLVWFYEKKITDHLNKNYVSKTRGEYKLD